MELIAEYLRRAHECRKLVHQTTIAAHRRAVEEICDTWARLAEERQRFLAQQQGNKTSD